MRVKVKITHKETDQSLKIYSDLLDVENSIMYFPIDRHTYEINYSRVCTGFKDMYNNDICIRDCAYLYEGSQEEVISQILYEDGMVNLVWERGDDKFKKPLSDIINRKDVHLSVLDP